MFYCLVLHSHVLTVFKPHLLALHLIVFLLKGNLIKSIIQINVNTEMMHTDYVLIMEVADWRGSVMLYITATLPPRLCTCTESKAAPYLCVSPSHVRRLPNRGRHFHSLHFFVHFVFPFSIHNTDENWLHNCTTPPLAL